MCLDSPYFIPASNEPSAVLARAFGECREGQYPAALQRCKFDAPLLEDCNVEKAGRCACEPSMD